VLSTTTPSRPFLMSTTAFMFTSDWRPRYRQAAGAKSETDGCIRIRMAVSLKALRPLSRSHVSNVANCAASRRYHAGGFSRAAERWISQSAVARRSRIWSIGWEHAVARGNPPQLTEAGSGCCAMRKPCCTMESEALADISQIKSGALSTLSLALSPARIRASAWSCSRSSANAIR